MKKIELGIFDIDKNTPTLNYKERLELYKKAGFTHLALYWDNEYLNEHENYKTIYEYAVQIGLVVKHVHLDYKKSNDLSLLGQAGESYFEYLKGRIKECKNYGIEHIIIHASKGDNAPIITKQGIERIKKLNNLLLNSNTFLCIENVRDNNNLNEIFKLQLANIKMCYDSGHAHCYSNEKEILTKFSTKIITTHLHNNFKKDTHQLLLDGTINWNDIMPLLKKTKRTVDYLEVFPSYNQSLTKDEFEAFLNKAIKEYISIIK